LRFSGPKTSIICTPMTSLKTSIKTITYLSDTGCLEIQGASLDVNQLTINAGYRESTHNTVFGFNCSACAQPHSPHHKIHFKKGGRAVTE
ncbi:hypothetical protein ACVHQX_002681, partial [Shigella boydii]